MTTLRIDVAALLDELGAETQIDQDVEVGPVRVGDEEFTPLGPAHVSATISNTGSGVLAHGRVKLDVRAECCKCLEQFDTTIETDLEAFYSGVSVSGTAADDADEYGRIEEGWVELGPALEAALAMEAPFAPVHSPDCRGICPQCGADLNAAACCCAPQESEGPFSALADLLGAHSDEED